MSKMSKYYKVVQPVPQAKVVQDSEDLTGGNLYAAYSWYQRLVQGSSTRQTRYREYDTMDEDVDVAIALDTIAEEMTSLNDTTNLPFTLEIHEDSDSVSPEFVHTLKIAVREWCKIHSWNSRLFPIARNLIKYGDCFFLKKHKTRKWEHLHPRHVLAAVVDKDNVTKVIGWQIRTNFKETKGSPFIGSSHYGQEYETQFLTTDEIVRFSTNDDMSEMAPFGESVLRAVYRSHKQKVLLEDSIIIYRVTRAPERRVFKIDVGKMPPMRVKQYLEQIKNDMKQKKIPSRSGDQNQVESVYNPHSASEDFFFAQRCLDLSTKIKLLDGRTLTLQDVIDEYKLGKTNFTYSINQQTGEFIPGEIEWAGVTRKNAELVKVTLDNGETITCTPDHKFVMRDGSEVEAQHLMADDSLMPLYTKFVKTNKTQRKVVSVEFLNDRADTGCLTIKDPGHNHNFALAAGVYVKNSDGKGSSVETLPGGNNLGEITDLEFFEHKVSRGLRIPESYWARKTSKEKPIFNDGRVGQAYIEELRFSKYVQRLQNHLQEVMDQQFKEFLRDLNLNVDESLFTLQLNEPLNFAKYRQQELDTQRLNTMNNAANFDVLSKRFMMERYLQLTKEEIALNERLLAQEKGINIDKDPNYINKIYNTSGNEYSGDFGSISGSTSSMTSDNTLSLEEPSTEEPSTEEPPTEEPPTEEPPTE